MPSATKPKAKSNDKPHSKPDTIRLDFEAIGTVWNIEFAAEAAQAPLIAKLIADRISEFDRSYSRFRSDSWVSNIRSPGSYKVPADFKPMFQLYQQLYKITDGAVTPLIGDAMERAGYDAVYSLETKELKPIPKFPNTVQLEDDTLHVKYECLLDFGALGKGYLVDLVAELLRKQGIPEFIVDAGGIFVLPPLL